MPNIEVKNLTHIYNNRRDKQTSLNDISVSFKSSKINVILGESGGGKTTLLRCLMGLEKYKGTILFDGSDVSLFQTNERNISYVNQNISLYPHMTIFNNIAYPLTLKNIDKDEIRERVFDIAKEFGIEELLFRKPRELSLGQCQRVAIARAIIKRPSLLLLDEPFSNLDETNSTNIGSFVREFVTKLGLTTIFVTHNQSEALRLGSSITIIEQGKILTSGESFEVFKDPRPEIHKYFIK
ncbi:MAG: ABC transporter ATP-binding protein [Bacilli bacterium]|nr:ABC transporter ATP-binding protein [Bacilli bacterium]